MLTVDIVLDRFIYKKDGKTFFLACDDDGVTGQAAPTASESGNIRALAFGDGADIALLEVLQDPRELPGGIQMKLESNEPTVGLVKKET